MALPTLKPTDRDRVRDRRHSDPPGLWFAVIVGSVVIHLLAFWMLRLLLIAGGPSWPKEKKLISIEVIPVAPKTTSPAQPIQPPSSAATRNPPSVSDRPSRTSNPLPNRQIPGVVTPSLTRSDSQQTGTKKQTTNPSPNQHPNTPTKKPSPAPNPSPNQSPGRHTPSTKPNSPTNTSTKPNSPTNTSTKPNSRTNTSTKPDSPTNTSTKPDSPTNNGTQPGGSATPSSPSATPSPGSSPGQNSPNSQPGGGLISSIGQLDPIPKRGEILHPDDPTYNDKLATLLEGDRQLAAEDLKQLGITLDRVLELKVGVLIETDGTATVLPNTTTVLQGNISADISVALASKIMQLLKFQPTLMAGKPVPREYYLSLTITPFPQ